MTKKSASLGYAYKNPASMHIDMPMHINPYAYNPYAYKNVFNSCNL